MRASTIVSPNLLADLAAFYPDTCTIQAMTNTQSASGAPVETWTDVPGLSGLGCTIAKDRSKAIEYWAAVGTITRDMLICDLPGFYDQITTKHRLVANGVNYNIIAVQWDSHHVMTELILETVTT